MQPDESGYGFYSATNEKSSCMYCQILLTRNKGNRDDSQLFSRNVISVDEKENGWVDASHPAVSLLRQMPTRHLTNPNAQSYHPLHIGGKAHSLTIHFCA